jgi:hypothetical protein
VKLKACSANDNGSNGIHVDAGSVQLDRFSASDLVVTGNAGDGILGNGNDTREMLFKRSTISGNGGHGIVSDHKSVAQVCAVKLVRDSTATGNGTSAECGVTRVCADIATCVGGTPQITPDAVCGTSYVLDSGIPGSNWGVRSLD